MSFHQKFGESASAFFTGIVGQITGMIMFESVWLPLALAFGGGFLGIVGKKAGEWCVKKVTAKLKTKRKSRIITDL